MNVGLEYISGNFEGENACEFCTCRFGNCQRKSHFWEHDIIWCHTLQETDPVIVFA